MLALSFPVWSEQRRWWWPNSYFSFPNSPNFPTLLSLWSTHWSYAHAAWPVKVKVVWSGYWAFSNLFPWDRSCSLCTESSSGFCLGRSIAGGKFWRLSLKADFCRYRLIWQKFHCIFLGRESWFNQDSIFVGRSFCLRWAELIFWWGHQLYHRLDCSRQQVICSNPRNPVVCWVNGWVLGVWLVWRAGGQWGASCHWTIID